MLLTESGGRVDINERVSEHKFSALHAAVDRENMDSIMVCALYLYTLYG